MKKVLLSFLSIALTVGIVSTSAYALFSDTVKVEGMTLASGNADLQISTVSNSSGFQENVTFNILSDKLFPGFTKESPEFWLKNNSQSNIDLNVTAQLISATEDPAGSWDALKDVVLVRITKPHTAGAPFIEYTLAQWNSAPRLLPWILSPVGDTDTYQVRVTMVPSAGNEAAMKKLENIRFDFVGTQN